MSRSITTTLVLVAFVASAACGPQVALKVTNDIEQGLGNADATFGIARISISKTGEDWITIAENVESELLAAGNTRELPVTNIPQGTYEGVKLEFTDNVSIKLEDGRTLNAVKPTLSYLVGGMDRCATEENGFSTGNEHFLFSTRNGALTQSIQIGAEEGRSLVFYMTAGESSSCSDHGPDIRFSAWLRYTGFTE